jgi:hypothetical protein
LAEPKNIFMEPGGSAEPRLKNTALKYRQSSNLQILHDKGGDDLLLVEEVDCVRSCFDGHVVESEKARCDEVEEKADDRSQTENAGHASGQDGQGGPAEIERLRIIHPHVIVEAFIHLEALLNQVKTDKF